MALVFRVMTPDADGLPKVGDESNQLGVRVRGRVDVVPDGDGMVHPKGDGMSVGPSLDKLPKFLVPERLHPRIRGARGDDDNRCYRMGEGPFLDGPFSERLRLRVDSVKHATVLPEESMTISDFQAALAATRNSWSDGEG